MNIPSGQCNNEVEDLQKNSLKPVYVVSSDSNEEPQVLTNAIYRPE